MRKYRVGLLTFSDGRRYQHEQLLPTNKRYQQRVKEAIEGTEEATVIEGQEIVWSNETARAEATRITQAGVDVVVFNYAIWCFPHLSAIAAALVPCPILLFSNLNPSEPGMVGMLASAGTMDQLGHVYDRVWGDIAKSDVVARVMTFIRAASAVSMLRGLTFGTFGGRPLGMYTATANVDQWQRDFGIDIESNEQSDIVTYAKEVPAAQVSGARKWLEEKVGRILYDGKALTPEKLQLAIRSYLALKQLTKERHFDFIGVKAQPELTESFVTMDLAEAFLNDPYDWDGAHEPVVASTESDMDGGLTMQLFKNVTRGHPVLFADVRHYDESRKLWYFSNSGMHPTFFAGASMHPEENLKNVTFYPEISDFPAGGPSVHHFAAPGKVTLARLARRKGKYWMALLRGDFVEVERRQALELGKTITPEWPIAFTRLGCTAEEFLSKFPCNHIHGVYGDFTREMIAVGKVMGIETRLFGAGRDPSFAQMGEDSNEE
ncbi:MAG: L-fucose/L-arabinose isomerase family protein [Syntrophobacteraceae bacterium]